MGPIGARTAGVLIGTYGLAAFLAPVAVLAIALALLRHGDAALLASGTAATLLLLPVVASLLHLWADGLATIAVAALGRHGVGRCWRQDWLFFCAQKQILVAAGHRPGLLVDNGSGSDGAGFWSC